VDAVEQQRRAAFPGERFLGVFLREITESVISNSSTAVVVVGNARRSELEEQRSRKHAQDKR
jgi:hypothetical protein